MSRKRRQRLKAHDQGYDRHNKGLSLLKKQSRLAQERAGINRSRKRTSKDLEKTSGEAGG